MYVVHLFFISIIQSVLVANFCLFLSSLLHLGDIPVPWRTGFVQVLGQSNAVWWQMCSTTNFYVSLQGVELSGLSAAISHFLNCFLSSFPNPIAHLPADELVSKKKNKKRKNRNLGNDDNTAWTSMTPQELWKNICSEAKSYFDFSLEW